MNNTQRRLDVLMTIAVAGMIALLTVPPEVRAAHPAILNLMLIAFSPAVVFWPWSFSVVSRRAPKESRVPLYGWLVILPFLAVPYVYVKYIRSQYEPKAV